MSKIKKRVAIIVVAVCMICSLTGNGILTIQNNDLKSKVEEAYATKEEQSVAYEAKIKELEEELTAVKKDYDGDMMVYDMVKEERERFSTALSRYIKKEAEAQGLDDADIDWFVDDDGHVKFWYYE